MKFTNQDFQAFLQENGSKYPYCEILTTRYSFHVKWLLVNWFKPKPERERYHPIPSSAFDKQTVNYLVCTKQVLPVPPTLERMVEYVYHWGVSHHSELWHHQVIEWVAFVLKTGLPRTAHEIFYECIEYRVRSIACSHEGLQAAELTEMALDQWVDYYWDLASNYGETDFIMLLIGSCNFMRTNIDRLLEDDQYIDTVIGSFVTEPAQAKSAIVSPSP